MRGSTKLLLPAALVLLGSLLGRAHVRLHNPDNGKPLYWAQPGSISVVVQGDGSEDVAGASDLLALRSAIDEWNGCEGTTARLIEDTDPLQQARTDWQADDLHLVLFDEDNSSDYFPPGSQIVALTPIWFLSDGRITDADVLFNGSGFEFTTSGEPGRFDVGDVGTHELGHLLGLDHSGWAGASLYPFVSPGVILHRSISGDEHVGLRVAYPESGGAYGRLEGTVRRPDGGPGVAGAHVWAVSYTHLMLPTIYSV